MPITLVNRGMSVTDAAMVRFVFPSPPRAGGLKYPGRLAFAGLDRELLTMGRRGPEHGSFGTWDRFIRQEVAVPFAGMPGWIFVGAGTRSTCPAFM